MKIELTVSCSKIEFLYLDGRKKVEKHVLEDSLPQYVCSSVCT